MSLETGVQASRNALEREKEEFKLAKDSLAHERDCFEEEKKRYREQVAAAASDMIFASELRRNSQVRNQMEQEAAEFRDRKSLLSAGYKIPFVLLLCYILVFTFNHMTPGTAFEGQIGFTFYIAWQCIRVIGLGLYYTAFFPLYSGIWIPEAPWEVAVQVVIGAIILMGFVFMVVRIVRFVIIPVIKFWRDKKIFDLTTLAVLTVLMSLAAISTATINSFALAMGVFALYIAIRSGCNYDWHTLREFWAIIRGKKSQDA